MPRHCVDHHVQPEVRATPHRRGGAEEDEPDERGAGHLVVPDEGALQHVARENAEQQVDRDHGEQHDAQAFHAVRRNEPQALLQGPHFAASRTLSIQSLPTFAPTSSYTGPIMSRNGLVSPMSFTWTPALRIVSRSPASLSSSALRSSAHASFAAASTAAFRSGGSALYFFRLVNQEIGS